MKNTDFRFIVGARGWRHAAWEGSYYPGDLPAEWRLGYYANDFTGVLIPARDWRDAPPEAWRRWHDDTPPGFRFLLETAPLRPDGGAPPTGLLGAKFAGWVARSRDRDASCLAAAALDDAEADRADVILCGGANLENRRALGRRLTEIAARATPPVALVALDDVAPSSLHDLRLLAELAGLA